MQWPITDPVPSRPVCCLIQVFPEAARAAFSVCLLSQQLSLLFVFFFLLLAIRAAAFHTHRHIHEHPSLRITLPSLVSSARLLLVLCWCCPLARPPPLTTTATSWHKLDCGPLPCHHAQCSRLNDHPDSHLSSDCVAVLSTSS